MSHAIEIRIRVPSDVGLTEHQIAVLKEKIKVEIVAMPAGGLTAKTPQQVVIQMVEGT